MPEVQVRLWTGSPWKAERQGFRAFEVAHPPDDVPVTEEKTNRGWIIMARCASEERAAAVAAALHKTYGWRVETWQVPQGTEATRLGTEEKRLGAW